MKKKIIILFGIMLAGVIFLVFKTMKDAGEFAKLEPHSNCRCVRVSNVPGPEDIAIDNATATAFISSFDRRAYMKGKVLQGAIFAYNLKGKPQLRNLTPNLKIKFYPHGISLYTTPEGVKFLFVINHLPGSHVVEVFQYRDGVLHHRETVRGGLLINPNDLAAVGPRQFYITNDHGSSTVSGKKIEDYLRLSRATVVYYDGKSMRTVADKLRYANGIWADKDGKHLYVASTTARRFYMYKMKADGSLELERDLDLGTAPDNIDVDEDGIIRIACHPRMLTLVKHMSDENKNAPSQIIEVFPDGQEKFSYKEIYLNSGDEISAASVAVVYRKRLLMGCIFGNFFLDCTME